MRQNWKLPQRKRLWIRRRRRFPELRRKIVAQEDQLSVLLRVNPGPVARDTNALGQAALPEIPPGLPSSLLERRPDVREAEQLMISANAQIGAAKANFYPQLTLTGLFGRVSPELSMLTAGGANAWEAAAELAGPLFEGGAAPSASAPGARRVG